MLLDYEILRVLWWGLLGVLLMGFAVMDGFDLGVAMWLPILGKTETDKRILINTIAPTWEGNQVWFILGGGAIFAAWPALYALSFSGFYLAMLLVLLALILRPVGFKYRSKVDHATWRAYWDVALWISGFVPTLIFGVAIGNVLQGVPFHFDETLRVFYTGSFLALLNPFAILCGLTSVFMLAMHGAFFLNIKTTAALQKRVELAAKSVALITFLLFIAGGVWAYTHIAGYLLASPIPHDGPSNPLYKTVSTQLGAWFLNYMQTPLLLVVPFTPLFMIPLACLFIRRPLLAFSCSALSLMGIIGTVGVSMFPFILPSSSDPGHSLLVWDSSSSQLTLWIMLIATLIFLPIVLTYTAWVYRVLRGKITAKVMQEHQETFY